MHSADSGGVLGALLGREGNHVLVNGRVRPTLTVRDGALQRWRIVNAAKSRYFELVLGDGQPFELIGVDGGHMEYSLRSAGRSSSGLASAPTCSWRRGSTART